MRFYELIISHIDVGTIVYANCAIHVLIEKGEVVIIVLVLLIAARIVL